MRSRSTPPKIIAPMRPLPIGNASVCQLAAGLEYQSLVAASLCGSALAV
jgi:hypothetical protein